MNEKKEATYKRPNHTMIEELQNMRRQNELCDVTIQVEEQSFEAHKVILSAAIGYFRKMFQSGLMEVDQDVVKLSGVRSENVEALFNFAYSGEVKMNEENVQSLMIDADYFGLIDISAECVKFIASTLNLQNAFTIYQFAEFLNCSSLLESSRETIRKNFSDAMKTQEFLSISFEILKNILTYVQTTSSEVIFDATIKWVTHNIEERKQYLSTLLQLFDFCELHTDYLTEYFYKPEMNTTSNEYKLLIYDVMSRHYQNKRPNSISANLDDKLFVIGMIDLKLGIEIYDPQTKEWHSSNAGNIQFNAARAEPLGILDIGDGIAYWADGSRVIAVNTQQKTMDKISSLPTSFTVRSQTIFGDFLYASGYDFRGFDTYTLVQRFCLKSKQLDTKFSRKITNAAFNLLSCEGYIYAIQVYPSDSVVRYNPETDKWVSIYIGKRHRGAYSKQAVLNRKIFVARFFRNERLNGSLDIGEHVFETFDLGKREWKQLASMKTNRRNFSLVPYNEKLWAIGGTSKIDGEIIALSSVEVYDPKLNSWSIASSMKILKGAVNAGVIANLRNTSQPHSESK